MSIHTAALELTADPNFPGNVWMYWSTDSAAPMLMVQSCETTFLKRDHAEATITHVQVVGGIHLCVQPSAFGCAW